MRLSRLATTLSLISALPLAACVSTPPPHERALINNELCAQELARGDLVRAETYCDLGLEFSPQYADLWANKGLVALSAGRKDDAKKHFIKALRFNQEHLQAYQNLGAIYFDEGAYGKAHDNFRRALKVNPDNLETRYNLALTFMKMKKLEQAKKELRTLLAVNPGLSDAHHTLGVIAYGENEFDEAVEHISQAVQLTPDAPAKWHDLGTALMELSRFPEAREAFANCTRLEPNNTSCVNNLSLAQRKTALTDAAFKELRDTQQAENSAPALFMLARQYREKGLIAEEEGTYRKCVKLDGKFAPCHFGLFQIFSDAHKRESAEVACKNFLKYGTSEEFPTEYQTCEKYLSDATF
ncbi:tetratricopeptide repeat protein [Pyxidicoccus fallax]|uniref:Tetratricopeptide repeat protein n=1 Tax=Pyxidicoccus fallax TaxID=394095 RepID=A0A848LX24_9BACT|nr:tetratricopeptide repeat protein [Pyxidicoccus fallax]NMO22595.1 tetratricopeptide repeat protein [Pyxidicoccus fallax]NPC86567.1 tetratricopeptide repeat protein [Pyxidicoccus fallax]